MKKCIGIALLLFTQTLYAQNEKGIQLKKDQTILVTSVTTMEADMGMGMAITNNTSSTNKLVVLAENNNQYTISNTLTKIKLTMDAMGQQEAYDSENPEKQNSEMAKSVGGKLQVPDTVSIDKLSGNLIRVKKVAEPTPSSDNPMNGLFSSMGNNNDDQAVGNAFFLIPAGKKIGDSWIDSSQDKSLKSIKTYTLQSIEKDIATLLLNGTMEANSNEEIQGSSIAIQLSTKLSGKILVHQLSGLVSERTLTSNITGSMEMMGQSMPLSSTVTSSFKYQ